MAMPMKFGEILAGRSERLRFLARVPAVGGKIFYVQATRDQDEDHSK